MTRGQDCCAPVTRTAGLYHSKFCEAHRNEPFGRQRNVVPKRRAEVASHATRVAHNWNRCNEPDCIQCLYAEHHLDDYDDRGVV